MSAFETSTDKLNYLKGLIRIAKCNGEIDPEEQNYYLMAANNMQLSTAELQEINALWSEIGEISISFSTKYDELFFLQEAIQLCCIDGRYDDAEKKELIAIAKEWGVGQHYLDEIHAWVIEGLDWKKRGEAMLTKMAERR